MPPETEAPEAVKPPPVVPNLRQLEPGSSGFVDPWCLVEMQYTPKPVPPNPDNPQPPEPYNPHSGLFFLYPHKPVYGAIDGVATMPVSRGADMGYSIDLTGHPLPNPPRLESGATIVNGEYLGCQVAGLDAALASPPPTAATEGEPAKPADAPKPPTKSVPVTPATKPVGVGASG